AGVPPGPGVRSTAGPPSRLGLPPLLVLARPQRLGRPVVQDPPGLRVAAHGPAGAVGDVAQVAQERALVPLLDLAVELGAAADRRPEVCAVLGVAAVALLLPQHLALLVADRVVAAADRQAALLAEEDHVRDLALRVLVAAQALPDDRLPRREVEADGVRVRRLLVVLEAVAAARGG